MPHLQQPPPSSSSSVSSSSSHRTQPPHATFRHLVLLPALLFSLLVLLLQPQPTSAFLVLTPSQRTRSTYPSSCTARRRASPFSLHASTLIMNEEVQANTKSGLPEPIKDKSVVLTDTSLKPFLEHIIAGASLSSSDVEAAFDRILAGADPVQVGALLAMLRQRGETPVEIAGMVRAMLKQRFPGQCDWKAARYRGHGGRRRAYHQHLHRCHDPRRGLWVQSCQARQSLRLL